jgi:hypothetical protein
VREVPGSGLEIILFHSSTTVGNGFKGPRNLLDAMAIRCAGLHNCHIALRP